MIVFPDAKINIGLYVTNKRSDGFHNIESVFYPVPFQDVLEILPAEKFSFHGHGIPLDGKHEDNLCVKAYQLLKQEYQLPEVEMHLLKNIPAGAGLGGGSSDASFTLKLLNEQFKLEIDNENLKEYAAILGSDCPFFIDNRPAYVSGRGEVLESVNLNLKGYHITIVHPGIHISTNEAFAHVKPSIADISVKEIINKPLEEWKDLLRNDFEVYAFNKYPVLAEIKKELYNAGALYAAMSGSGSAVYGIGRKPIEIVFNDFLIWKGML
jgi:4-diphosphocytidyl-2-C-methyl-D-erythritol kinase